MNKAPRCPECGAPVFLYGDLMQEVTGSCTNSGCDYQYDSAFDEKPQPKWIQ